MGKVVIKMGVRYRRPVQSYSLSTSAAVKGTRNKTLKLMVRSRSGIVGSEKMLMYLHSHLLSEAGWSSNRLDSSHRLAGIDGIS